MDQLGQFGTELSVNRVANGEFTPAARGFTYGAAAAGESHSRIAKAVGAKDSSTVTRIINRISTKKTAVTANSRCGKYKTTPRDELHLVILARKFPEATYWDIIRRAGLDITYHGAERCHRTASGRTPGASCGAARVDPETVNIFTNRPDPVL
jgi:hypothetical protein